MSAKFSYAPRDGQKIHILRSRADVAEFMKGRPDPDQIYSWVCPRCHSRHEETHFGYDTPCPSCGEFKFPLIPLPIVDNAKNTIRTAFLNNHVLSMRKDIEEAEHEIEHLRHAIEKQEAHIAGLKGELKKYECALEMNKK